MSNLVHTAFINISLKDYLSLFNENDYTLVSFSWSNDKEIKKMNRLSKKGYFKRISTKGFFKYIRTSKQYIERDTVKKPIQKN